MATAGSRPGYWLKASSTTTSGWNASGERRGLKVPARQPKRVWLNDSCCIRLRPRHPYRVWAYDFIEDCTRDGRRFRTLNVIDKFACECLSHPARHLKPCSVKQWARVRSHRRGELHQRRGHEITCIEPGSSWESGYVESFNGKLRDELLNTEVFNTLAEAKVLIEQWRRHYNTVRPHSSLRYRPPAPEMLLTSPTSSPSFRSGQDAATFH